MIPAKPIVAGIVSALLVIQLGCAGTTSSAPTAAFKRDIAVGQRWYETGLTFAKRNQHDKAINAFASALRNDPMHGLAHLEKAESHLFADADPATIQRHLEDAVALLPRNPRAHHRLAAALAAVGDEDGALRHWRQAVALRPTMIEARLQLATLLLGTGALAEAQQHLEEAVAQQPENVQARVRLGQVLERAARPQDAARQLEIAAAAAGSSAALYRRAAALYETAGDGPQAIKLRRKADELDPPPAARKYRQLRKARRRR